MVAVKAALRKKRPLSFAVSDAAIVEVDTGEPPALMVEAVDTAGCSKGSDADDKFDAAVLMVPGPQLPFDRSGVSLTDDTANVAVP